MARALPRLPRPRSGRRPWTCQTGNRAERSVSSADSIWLLPLPGAAAADRVQADRQDEDDAGGDVLGRLGLADEVEAVLDAADHQCPEKRVVDAAAAAEQARAADDRRG